MGMHPHFPSLPNRYLSSIGELIYLPQPGPDRTDDIIVLDIPWLCSKTIGAILSPPQFLVDKVKSSCGLVERSSLERVFRDSPVPLYTILQILERLQLCFAADPDRMAFVFPALLRKEEDKRPEGVWAVSNTLTKYFGKRLLCVGALDMFSPGFFPRFQVLSRDHFGAGMRMWHGGVASTITGVLDCVVQLADDKRSVDVWMCCTPDALEAALQFAEAVS